MPFGSLWLPVLVSAVAVFIASSLLHMVIKHHKGDYKPFGDEGAVRATLGKEKLAPGIYVVPYCGDMSQMKDPAQVKKYEEGPIAIVTVMKNGMPAMGKYLTMWFFFCILVSFVTAYVARHTLHYGENGMLVLRITGAVSFAAYGMGCLQDLIWKSVPPVNTVRFLFDAAVYSVVTALCFMLLWPAA